jgi:hypothetical protein
MVAASIGSGLEGLFIVAHLSPSIDRDNRHVRKVRLLPPALLEALAQLVPALETARRRGRLGVRRETLRSSALGMAKIWFLPVRLTHPVSHAATASHASVPLSARRMTCDARIARPPQTYTGCTLRRVAKS